MVEAAMNQHAVVGKFSHVKPGDTDYTEGACATSSCIAISASRCDRRPVICHLVKANPDMPPEDGTGCIAMIAIFRS